MMTGGRGFAARHLVVMLLRYGDWSVRIADLGPSIKLKAYEEEDILSDAVQSGKAQYHNDSYSATKAEVPQVLGSLR
ncbi:hypothetical protein Sjap_021407 [Stephania japonica]|uniref:3-beta hydroxysteroid dehydrogenase/isomerase domain-containing protein n=1 Tax=Stephania japonica TaxID=461633 RepID=A0AAP0HU32_9MAGN